MRAGGYTVHQSLTAEAAAALKLSLCLARRRGHAQATPLHVAYTLLGLGGAPLSTPPYGLLLRRACARSSHPAQCRALELCFNVALNRLPTAAPLSSPSSFLHQQQPCPSTLSNALVAALKRAQASQRRGCVDLQATPSPPPSTSSSTSQQPVMVAIIRVELEQLVISILDDPSVSRVMREAGFSSAAVKASLEDESAEAAAMVPLASSTPSHSPAPSFLEPFASAYGGGGGLGLDLELGPRAATREMEGKVAQLAHFPLLDFSPKEEDGVVPALCAECARNYEIEASAVRAKAQGTNLALTFFPGWPQADEPQTSHKDDLMDLKMKWSVLCQRVHLRRNHPSNATTSGNLGLSLSFGTSEIKHQDVKTTLSLLPPDSASASSDEVQCHNSKDDMDTKQATAQEPDMVVDFDSGDMKNVLRLWIDEVPSSDLKRKAENVRPPSESKRWRGGCGIDLNLCADDEGEDPDGGSASGEDEIIPSDLTNDGEESGDMSVTDSLDSHC